MDIRQEAKDFLITFPLALIVGGALLWGSVWVWGLLDESRPPLEARKSETLSVAELEAGPGDASPPPSRRYQISTTGG
jgi:hypothetical protein